jgi:hypothetical protein
MTKYTEPVPIVKSLIYFASSFFSYVLNEIQHFSLWLVVNLNKLFFSFCSV